MQHRCMLYQQTELLGFVYSLYRWVYSILPHWRWRFFHLFSSPYQAPTSPTHYGQWSNQLGKPEPEEHLSVLLHILPRFALRNQQGWNTAHGSDLPKTPDVRGLRTPQAIPSLALTQRQYKLLPSSHTLLRVLGLNGDIRSCFLVSEGRTRLSKHTAASLSTKRFLKAPVWGTQACPVPGL